MCRSGQARYTDTKRIVLRMVIAVRLCCKRLPPPPTSPIRTCSVGGITARITTVRVLCCVVGRDFRLGDHASRRA